MLKQKYRQQVLEDMINREAVFQEAKRLGVTVDPKRMEDELAQSIRREMAFAQVESLDVVLERLRKVVGVQLSGQMPH
jgi:hypothetical protein